MAGGTRSANTLMHHYTNGRCGAAQSGLWLVQGTSQSCHQSWQPFFWGLGGCFWWRGCRSIVPSLPSLLARTTTNMFKTTTITLTCSAMPPTELALHMDGQLSHLQTSQWETGQGHDGCACRKFILIVLTTSHLLHDQ